MGPRSMPRSPTSVAAAVLGAVLELPYRLMHVAVPERVMDVAAAITLVLLIGIALSILQNGLRALRFVTLVPVVIAMAYLVRVDGPALDAKISDIGCRGRARRGARTAVPAYACCGSRARDGRCRSDYAGAADRHRSEHSSERLAGAAFRDLGSSGDRNGLPGSRGWARARCQDLRHRLPRPCSARCSNCRTGLCMLRFPSA